MSGPIAADDAAPRADVGEPETCDLQILPGRKAQVGAFGVRRVLPRRERRTVGAWCFVDHMGPGHVAADRGLDIGPHPHIGLQTVTWLVTGEILHRDSLGSEQLIRPGQLNLMTAGHGVSHSEETAGVYVGELHGVQLWVAQPAATRNGEPGFEHHPELPRSVLGEGVATVLVGEFGDVASGARRDTEHVGVDIELGAGTTTVPLDHRFEYALVVLAGAVTIGSHRLEPGALGYIGTGRDDVPVVDAAPAAADGPTRVLLIGGVPFDEPVLMWWNYVARTRDEITAAHRAWTAGAPRFGRVASPLPRIDANGPPWDGGSARA